MIVILELDEDLTEGWGVICSSHSGVVHMASVERVGLLASRTSIAIPILRLRTICGIVPWVLALETGDVAQILLHWCSRVGTVLIAIPSIVVMSIAIVMMAIVFVVVMTILHFPCRFVVSRRS